MHNKKKLLFSQQKTFHSHINWPKYPAWVKSRRC